MAGADGDVKVGWRGNLGYAAGVTIFVGVASYFYPTPSAPKEPEADLCVVGKFIDNGRVTNHHKHDGSFTFRPANTDTILRVTQVDGRLVFSPVSEKVDPAVVAAAQQLGEKIVSVCPVRGAPQKKPIDRVARQP